MFIRIIFLAVVIEKVVEKPCPCGTSCIKAEFFADYVTVIRYIYAMLIAGSIDMVSYIFEFVETWFFDNIGNARIIATEYEFLF